MTKESKAQRKQLTIDINDPEAVFARFPNLKREDFVKPAVDVSALRRAIRPLAYGLHAVGEQIPGVNAYYAGEKAPAPESTPRPTDSHQTEAAEDELHRLHYSNPPMQKEAANG